MQKVPRRHATDNAAGIRRRVAVRARWLKWKEQGAVSTVRRGKRTARRWQRRRALRAPTGADGRAPAADVAARKERERPRPRSAGATRVSSRSTPAPSDTAAARLEAPKLGAATAFEVVRVSVRQPARVRRESATGRIQKSSLRESSRAGREARRSQPAASARSKRKQNRYVPRCSRTFPRGLTPF